MNRRKSDQLCDQLSRFDTMVLRPALVECPVDSNTSKMYILDNRVSSRDFTRSTIPYLSTTKEVEWKPPSPTAGKSKRSRVSFRDDTDQECCVFDPRFAPQSIPKRQSSSKTKVTQATSVAPAIFLLSKVFVKRRNNAAIKIQTQARRAFQRQRYLRILLTKVEAEILAFYEKAAAMKLEAAVTTMQALVRGAMCRMHFQVRKLEFRLLQSGRLLKAQLEDIQKDKEHQMAAIYEEEKAKMEKLAKDRTVLVQNINENVRLLRKENKILRSNNKKIRRSIDVFKKLNNRLGELTAGFGDESVKLNNIIFTCEKENKEWVHLEGLYEDRIVKYKEMIEERSERTICEREVAKKTRESIVNIVRIVEDEAEDEELVREVIELGESTIVKIVEDEAEAEELLTEVIELGESTIATIVEGRASENKELETEVIQLGESTIATIFEDETSEDEGGASNRRH
jgi:hypothetical protein